MSDESYRTASLQLCRERKDEAGNTILQLRDRIVAESRDFNSEERVAWDKANKDYDSFSALVETKERARDIEADDGRRYDAKPGLENTTPGKRHGDNAARADALDV